MWTLGYWGMSLRWGRPRLDPSTRPRVCVVKTKFPLLLEWDHTDGSLNSTRPTVRNGDSTYSFHSSFGSTSQPSHWELLLSSIGPHGRDKRWGFDPNWNIRRYLYLFDPRKVIIGPIHDKVLLSFYRNVRFSLFPSVLHLYGSLRTNPSSIRCYTGTRIL